MRRYLILLLTAVLTVSAAGCASSTAVQSEVKPKPVKVIEINEQTIEETLLYFGFLKSGEVKKISFKTSGKVSSIPVEKGQQVEKGTVLARLETKDLGFGVEASKAQLDSLSSQYNAAESGYEYARNNFSKVQSLYDEGAVSKSKYDEAKLNLDLALSDLNSVKELKNQAAADYQYKTSMLEDAVMVSDMDGYVAEILYKEGEIAPAGYPVVVLRNGSQVASTGLSQSDASKVMPGMKALVEVEGTEISGTVSSVSQVPDSSTRTYEAEISLSDSSFPLGSAVKVKIVTGEVKGIWIPVSSIMSGNEDYVYIAADNRAVKTPVDIKYANGNKARVEGLTGGQKLVVEGINGLTHMDSVSIQK